LQLFVCLLINLNIIKQNTLLFHKCHFVPFTYFKK